MTKDFVEEYLLEIRKNVNIIQGEDNLIQFFDENDELRLIVRNMMEWSYNKGKKEIGEKEELIEEAQEIIDTSDEAKRRIDSLGDYVMGRGKY